MDFEPSDFGKWHIRQGPEPNGFGKSDWGQTRAYEWFGTTTVTHNAVSCRSHLRSLLLARQSIHKCDPPLGFNLDCSRWLHRQLKNCSFLTFSHRVQERDLAVWKFQRIMMSRDLFLVDLPKDRRLVPDHLISPAKDTNRLAHDLASKRQFGSWSNADHHVRIF